MSEIKPSVVDQLIKINENIWELYEYESHVDPDGEDMKFYSELFNKIDSKIAELDERAKHGKQ